jgi:signal peptidase II
MISATQIKRYGVVAGVTCLVAVTDLVTKRWAETALATEDHLIPIHQSDFPQAKTVRELARSRFPDLEDADLNGQVYCLREIPAFSKETLVQDAFLDAVSPLGFFVFDRGDTRGFARRVFLVSFQRDVERDTARRELDRVLKMPLAQFLSEKLSHLDEDDIEKTLKGGVFPIRSQDILVNPDSSVVNGAIYLLASRTITLIPNYLDFSYVENPAGAWGLLSGVDETTRKNVFFALSVVAIIAVLVLLVRPPGTDIWSLASLGMIMGGAIGNVVDRLTLGYVVDFIHMYWGNYHWPKYNVADIGITVGVVILFLISTFQKKKPRKEQNA